MAKFFVIVALISFVVLSIDALNFGDCPLSSQMVTCTPKCTHDTDCSQMGGICCPNQCNTKSCARPKAGSQGSSSGSYKGSATSTATGIYCGNVKCSSYEKCGLDKSTKRQQCIRQ